MKQYWYNIIVLMKGYKENINSQIIFSRYIYILVVPFNLLK